MVSTQREQDFSYQGEALNVSAAFKVYKAKKNLKKLSVKKSKILK